MNIQILNDYKERGLLMNQVHPTLPLIIWNYTPKVQYEQLWDEVTIQCRGLVTDTDATIVARGFNKFFNIEENRHTPTEMFEVFEKLDGQLILVFWYDGEMVVASRGSFTSKYAIEAKRLLDEKYPDFVEFGCYYDLLKITHCFELIGFEQIVVSYPESDLIHTGCFRNDGVEGWKDLPLESNENLKIPKLVKKFDGLDWKNIKELNWQNAEGFVVRFSNGSRCKIKFEDYVKLHRQMTNLSTTAIWEALMEGKPVSSILEDVPDEFYDKVHQYENELKNSYALIEKQMEVDFDDVERKCYDKEGISARKHFALLAQQKPNPNLLFALYDGKDYSKMIWKMIKPKFEKI